MSKIIGIYSIHRTTTLRQELKERTSKWISSLRSSTHLLDQHLTPHSQQWCLLQNTFICSMKNARRLGRLPNTPHSVKVPNMMRPGLWLFSLTRSSTVKGLEKPRTVRKRQRQRWLWKPLAGFETSLPEFYFPLTPSHRLPGPFLSISFSQLQYWLYFRSAILLFA